MTDSERDFHKRYIDAVTVAREALSQAERRLKSFEDTLSPVQIGEIVEVRSKRYRVSRIENLGNPERPWLYGNSQNKDGKWSHSERGLYDDWAKVS